MSSCEEIRIISTVEEFKSFLPYSPSGTFVLPPDVNDNVSGEQATDGYTLNYNEVFEKMLDFSDGMLVVKTSDVASGYSYPGEELILCRTETDEEEIYERCIENVCGVNQLFAHVVMLVKYQRELSNIILDDKKETYINRVERKVNREEKKINKLVHKSGVMSVSVREYTTGYTPVLTTSPT